MMQRKPRSFKFVAGLVLFSFSFNTIASPAPPLPKPEVRIPSLADSLQIPESLGRIEQRFAPALYSADGLASAPFVIHIQDAHSSYEAQIQTCEILKFLKEKYALDLVFLEGYFLEGIPRIEILERKSPEEIKALALSIEKQVRSYKEIAHA